MAMMDTRIPLAIRQPNTVNALAGGIQAASMANQVGQQNALRQLYAQQGPGIAAGEQNALNALSRLDPGQARGIRESEERLKLARAAGARAAAAAARDERQRKQLEQEFAVLRQGALAYQQAQNGNPEAFRQWAGVSGISMDDFPVYLATAQGGMEMLQRLQAGQSYGQPAAPEYKTVGNTLYEIVPGQPPRAVGSGEAAVPGFSVVTPDGTTVQYGQTTPAGQSSAGTASPRDAGTLSKELSKGDAAYLETEKQNARAAEDLARYAEVLRLTAPNIGYTGPGGKLYGNIDQAIGVLPGDEAQRSVFRSNSMDARLTFTEKTKGAITDREMAGFEMAVPNENARSGSNVLLADALEAGANRVQMRSNFFEDWARKYGSLEGAEQVWDQYMEANPIFSVDNGKLVIRDAAPTEYRPYLNALPAMAYTPQAIMGLTLEQLNAAPIEVLTLDQLNALELRRQQLEGN